MLLSVRLATSGGMHCHLARPSLERAGSRRLSVFLVGRHSSAAWSQPELRKIAKSDVPRSVLPNVLPTALRAPRCSAASVTITSSRRFASSEAPSEQLTEQLTIEEAPRENHLPAWAQQEERPPAYLRLLTAALLAPLGVGALAVHGLGLISEDDDDVDESVARPPLQGEYSRIALSWTLHYAGALLSFAGAAHWGMQLAEFGVPRRSDYMALYYLSRFSAPITFVLFGWLGSVLSVADSTEAIMWLACGFVGLLSCDFLAKAFFVAPPWWFRWRAGFSVSAVLSLGVLLLSERNMYLGPKPKIRM